MEDPVPTITILLILTCTGLATLLYMILLAIFLVVQARHHKEHLLDLERYAANTTNISNTNTTPVVAGTHTTTTTTTTGNNSPRNSPSNIPKRNSNNYNTSSNNPSENNSPNNNNSPRNNNNNSGNNSPRNNNSNSSPPSNMKSPRNNSPHNNINKRNSSSNPNNMLKNSLSNSTSSSSEANYSPIVSKKSGIDYFPKISDPSLAEDLISKFIKHDKPNTTSLQSTATVVFDFTAQQKGDLTIRVGDIVTILKRDPSGWWLGKCNNNTGSFPYNYVKIIEGNETRKEN